jgi:hypothetical protein
VHRNLGQYPTAIDQGAGWHFNLSQNKSLRTLETTAASITAKDVYPDFLTAVLSTITSPLPLDVIIDYDDFDVDRMRRWAANPTLTYPLPVELEDQMAKNVLRHEQRFKLFQEMYRVRRFRLVLCADVSNHSVEPAVQTLKNLVKAEKAMGRLGYLHCEVLIISEKRTLQTYVGDNQVGHTRLLLVSSSAL